MADFPQLVALRAKVDRSFLYLRFLGNPPSWRRAFFARNVGRYVNPNGRQQRNVAMTVKNNLYLNNYTSTVHEIFFQNDDCAYELNAVYHFPRPLYHFIGRRRENRHFDRIKPQFRDVYPTKKKKDLDNLVKFMMDAFNRSIYHDDSCITKFIVEKRYDNEGTCDGRFEITITKRDTNEVIYID